MGVDGYEAAGGIVMRDLFQHDDGGWLQDPALLDRLVTEKLQAAPRFSDSSNPYTLKLIGRSV